MNFKKIIVEKKDVLVLKKIEKLSKKGNKYHNLLIFDGEGNHHFLYCPSEHYDFVSQLPDNSKVNVKIELIYKGFDNSRLQVQEIY